MVRRSVGCKGGTWGYVEIHGWLYHAKLWCVRNQQFVDIGCYIKYKGH